MDTSTRAPRTPSASTEPPPTLASGTTPSGEPVLLSLVIPVFNEEATLDALFTTIRERVAILDVSYEVVLVDDGSRDRTSEMIAEMTRRDSRFRSVHFTTRSSSARCT